MDTLTGQVLMAHKAILFECISRITALERLLSPDGHSEPFAPTDVIDLAKCPPFDTDGENSGSDA